MWRTSGARRAVLVETPALPAGEQVSCAAVDSEGRVVLGRRDRTDRAAIRPAAESQLPWTLYVSGGAPNPPGTGLPESQRYLLLGMGVMVLFLVAGTYFIARAIRREMEVSRMQSDFVSAVSHEFRSPLTSIRQLSEILELGRVPSDERRQVYYTTLVRETQRLQRLVEALLNFGRMEAGARAYRFEEIETASLVHRVAGEFEAQLAAGRRIELQRSRSHVRHQCRPGRAFRGAAQPDRQRAEILARASGDLGAMGHGARAGGHPGARRGAWELRPPSAGRSSENSSAEPPRPRPTSKDQAWAWPW